MFARRHTGISLILPGQDKHMGGWLQIRANQASLESARQGGRFGPAGFKRGADSKVLRVHCWVKATRTKML